VIKINKKSVVKFIKSVVCRFEVPNRIITDNRSQFTSSVFQGYCEDLGIQIYYASVAHLENNGQVERANTKILKGHRTHTYDSLKKHGTKLIDELPRALWANRTSSSRATGEMPFFLVYGVEAVTPQKSPWSPPVSRHTTMPRRTRSDVMMSTSSTNKDGKQLSKMHGTARCSSATTNSLCTIGSFRWMIWCSSAYFSVKV
jgi:hypothetical protein